LKYPNGLIFAASTEMKKICSVIGFLLLAGTVTVVAQTAVAVPIIGRHAQDVEKYIRQNLRELSLDQTTRNTAYKYLKYQDQLGYMTLLVFLSEDDTCTWYKGVYDPDWMERIIQDLNACCKRESDTSWIEISGDLTYRKVLKEDQWFFSVTTKPVSRTP